jgi:hypothetical protein
MPQNSTVKYPAAEYRLFTSRYQQAVLIFKNAEGGCEEPFLQPIRRS